MSNKVTLYTSIHKFEQQLYINQIADLHLLVLSCASILMIVAHSIIKKKLKLANLDLKESPFLHFQPMMFQQPSTQNQVHFFT